MSRRDRRKTGEDEAELTSPEDVEKLKSLCSLRRLHEKLKSLCSVRRLHLAPMKGAGETVSSTWDQVEALSTENEAGTR